jgi:outer membrane immunogenic protein
MRSAKFMAGAVIVAGALAGVSAASAADMAPWMYTKAPIPAVIYDWTGFYIGGNVGYSWGRASTDGNVSGTQGVSVFRTASGGGPTVVTALAALPISGRANVNGVIGGG